MTVFEDSFVSGVIRKTLAFGILGALLACFAHSVGLAGGIAIGMLVAVTNLRLVAWTVRKMLDAGKRGEASAGAWTALLFGKTLILFGVIWYLIVRLGVDGIGFVIGFSAFLPAIGWETIIRRPGGDEPQD